VLACTPGNAAAAGTSATISIDQTISGNVGNATADGLAAGIIIDQTIACSVGDAVAAGTACTIDLAGGTASAAEVWSYVMTNGFTAEENVVAIRSMLEALTPAVIADEVLHNALV